MNDKNGPIREGLQDDEVDEEFSEACEDHDGQTIETDSPGPSSSNGETLRCSTRKRKPKFDFVTAGLESEKDLYHTQKRRINYQQNRIS